MSDKTPKVSFGQTVAALILTVAIFALTFVVIFHLGPYTDWLVFAVAFLISSVIGTVIHEGGHIVAALGFGWPVGEVRLGSGPVLVHFHFRNAIVRVGSWPFGGGKVWLGAGAKLGKWDGVAFSAAGIAVNTVAAAFALGFSNWSPTVFTAFFLANAFMAVANVIPTESEDGGPNDGTQIFFRLGMLAQKSNPELARAISQMATVIKLEDLALEVWTASADQALSVALHIAEASGALQLGTEHLLAGVLADKESPGARTLTDMGFNADRLLPILVKGGATAPPSWSNEALTAVMFAIDAADPALGAGSGELCQGVLAATKGRGHAILKESDITLGGFREELEPLRQQEVIVGCTKAMYFAWAIRATVRLRAKRNAEARADYLVMTPLAPGPHERAVALNNTAWTSLLIGDPAWRADALERAQQAIAIEPDAQFIRSTVAYALLENGKPVEALASFDSLDDAKTPPPGKASNPACVRWPRLAWARSTLPHVTFMTRRHSIPHASCWSGPGRSSPLLPALDWPAKDAYNSGCGG